MFKLTKRLRTHIVSAIDAIGLDLKGLTVMTEIGFGPYNITPLLAGLAGAKVVHCVVRPLGGHSVEDLKSNFFHNLNVAGCDASRFNTIESRDSDEAVRETDLFTNLGALRPFDRPFIGRMNRGAAISTMFEKWEFREEDIDLSACYDFGVRVAGTNENDPRLNVFSYTGHLGQKLLYEAGCVVLNSRILIVSPDHFGETMHEHLSKAGAIPTLVEGWSLQGVNISDYDAVYAANFTDDSVLTLTPTDLETMKSNGIPLVQLCGLIEGPSEVGLMEVAYPKKKPRAKYMTETLAYLGPEPVVYLNLLGLKAAEEAFKHRPSGFSQPINFNWT